MTRASVTHAVVVGRCPVCGNETLRLDLGGHVVCTWVECDQPTFVAELLASAEREHIVEFTEEGWTVLHPLRERGEDLFACAINDDMRALHGTPEGGTGRYRAIADRGEWNGWRLERL